MRPEPHKRTPALSSVARDPFEQHPLALTDGGWDTRQVRMAHDGVEPSVGSVGDSYDNALVDTINDLYKTEVIRPLAKPRSRPVHHAGMSRLV
jgi:transposase InsO family protein